MTHPWHDDIYAAPRDGTIFEAQCAGVTHLIRWNHDFNVGYEEDGPGYWEEWEAGEWCPCCLDFERWRQP